MDPTIYLTRCKQRAISALTPTVCALGESATFLPFDMGAKRRRGFCPSLPWPPGEGRQQGQTRQTGLLSQEEGAKHKSWSSPASEKGRSRSPRQTSELTEEEIGNTAFIATGDPIWARSTLHVNLA